MIKLEEGAEVDEGEVRRAGVERGEGRRTRRKGEVKWSNCIPGAFNIDVSGGGGVSLVHYYIPL